EATQEIVDEAIAVEEPTQEVVDEIAALEEANQEVVDEIAAHAFSSRVVIGLVSGSVQARGGERRAGERRLIDPV
ncbi:MAG: hypothetical protein NTV19_01920, partial [Burkholderiales bacterium]|nr:hypothetical protein [Burkholderiales bacterium]